jgi:hypothetical protein
VDELIRMIKNLGKKETRQEQIRDRERGETKLKLLGGKIKGVA